MRWPLPACLIALLLAGAPRAHSQASERPLFRSGVDLVTVTATVRDARGRLVTNLAAHELEILDRGVSRPIAEFRAERAAVSLAMLVDTSGSMRMASRLTAARFAAHHLLAWLEPGRDEAALFTFDSRLRVVVPFTADTRALEGALGEVEPYGATALHDAVAAAAVQAAARRPRRSAVVVITDGIDTASTLTAAEVSGIASRIDVPVYVLAVVLPIDGREGGRPAPAPDAGRLDDLARWTGGALFRTTAPAETSRTARAVVDELRHQYLIAFEPAPGTGWHPLEVRVARRRHEVRVRGGYVREPQPSR